MERENIVNAIVKIFPAAKEAVVADFDSGIDNIVHCVCKKNNGDVSLMGSFVQDIGKLKDVVPNANLFYVRYFDDEMIRIVFGVKK